MPRIPDGGHGGAHHHFATPRSHLNTLLARCLANYEVGHVPEAAEAARQLIKDLGDLHSKIHDEVRAKLAGQRHGA